MRVEGTDFPVGMRGFGMPDAEQVTAAVSALTRRTPEQLLVRGPGRTLLVQALAACTSLSVRAIGEHVGISHVAVVRTGPIDSQALRVVERVVGDLRFDALVGFDLSTSWAWRAYLRRRERKGGYDLLLQRAVNLDFLAGCASTVLLLPARRLMLNKPLTSRVVAERHGATGQRGIAVPVTSRPLRCGSGPQPRVSLRYLMRCGWSASAPRRRLRSRS